ncbi:MAG: peptidylprolyl isomerase [Elusimicrobiota bacterium]
MKNTEQTQNMETREYGNKGIWKQGNTIKYLFLYFYIFIFSYFSCLSAAVVNKTIAKVNDEVILQKDYDEVVNPVIEQLNKNYSEVISKEELDKKIDEIKKELLNQMIDQKLLLQEAKKKNIKVNKREIENGIEIVKERFKQKNGKLLTPTEAEAEFQAEMRKQNLTMTQFRDKIREDIMVNKLIDSEVVSKVTPPLEDELKNYYEKNKDKLDEPEKVSVKHILIRVDKNASTKDRSQALNKIKEIQQKLKKGDDFAKLAEEYSEDPGSAQNGGDLGFIVRGMMVKNFEDAAFKTPVGEISDFFETEFGYHILKVEAKQAKQKRTYSQVKNNLEKYLVMEKRQQHYENYIKSIRDKSNISTSDIK